MTLSQYGDYFSDYIQSKDMGISFVFLDSTRRKLSYQFDAFGP